MLGFAWIYIMYIGPDVVAPIAEHLGVREKLFTPLYLTNNSARLIYINSQEFGDKKYIIFILQGVPKKCRFLEKWQYTPSNSLKMPMLGVFWKIQGICYIMGTEILKIEEEMTEKMKSQVANPTSRNGQNSLPIICTPLMSLCIFMTCNESKTCSICWQKVK